MTTIEMINGCREGNRKAQNKLFETQYAKLKGVCNKYSKEYGEDMTQEAFLLAFELFHGFDGKSEGELFAWLKKLAINYFIWTGHSTGRFNEDKTNFSEESFKHPTVDAKLPEVSDEVKPTEVDNQVNDIMWAIDMLDDDKRPVFNMVSIDGLTLKQTAKKLNISYSCCMYRYKKANKKVKMYIKNKELLLSLNKIAKIE